MLNSMLETTCFSKYPLSKVLVDLGRKGKLVYFFITEYVGKISYRLVLPQHMLGIHPVFHVSMLRKHVKDDNRVVVPNTLGVTVRPDTSYEVELVCILARSERKLHTKVQKMVIVL